MVKAPLDPLADDQRRRVFLDVIERVLDTLAQPA